MEKEGQTYVVLVDEHDREIGMAEKLEAHSGGGKLHRAVSVLVFNPRGEMLLQKRANAKYHSAGLWSNTCCTHPAPGESTDVAAKRRLREELGFETSIKEYFEFIYRADVGGGLTEWEYDHVFFGEYEGQVRPNPEEVSDYRWVDLDSLLEDVEKNPQNYTKWFIILLKQHQDKIRSALESLKKHDGVRPA